MQNLLFKWSEEGWVKNLKFRRDKTELTEGILKKFLFILESESKQGEGQR